LQDYLTLPDPSQIYKMSSLDMAFTTAYNSTRDFAMRTFNLTEDQAITAVTTVMDFGVTQVVDGKSACAVVDNQTHGFACNHCAILVVAHSMACRITRDRKVRLKQLQLCRLLFLIAMVTPLECMLHAAWMSAEE